MDNPQKVVPEEEQGLVAVCKEASAKLCPPDFIPLTSSTGGSSTSSGAATSSSLSVSSIAEFVTSSSAKQLASGVNELNVDKLHEKTAEVLEGWAQGQMPTPARLITGLAEAHSAGQPVEEVLLARAASIRLEGKRKSLPSVAAALR